MIWKKIQRELFFCGYLSYNDSGKNCSLNVSWSNDGFQSWTTDWVYGGNATNDWDVDSAVDILINDDDDVFVLFQAGESINNLYVNGTEGNPDLMIAVYEAPADTGSSEYSLGGGLDNSRIKFYGDPSETVWSNESVAGKNVTIYTELVTGDNCIDIYINFNNTNMTNASKQSNCTIDNNLKIEMSLDDSNWTGNTYTITSSLINLSLNTSDSGWGAGSPRWRHGDNPFMMSQGDGNVSIFVRMTYTIPGGVTEGNYTADNWQVIWKIE